MDYEKAVSIANDIFDKLKFYCDRIEIAGSIRRKRKFCHDIDLVCIPSNQGQFIYQLQQLGKVKVGGQKLIRVDLNEHPGFPLDIYIATPETWATLLLIRTGSKEHNIRLCKLAQQKGMKLHADGSGLFRLGGMVATGDAADGDREEIRIAGDTEESIFQALGIPYLPPEKRY